MLQTGPILKSFFSNVKYLSHWSVTQTPEALSNNMNLFWDKQTGWLNHRDTWQCNVLNPVCLAYWHCHECAPSVCPVLSDHQAVKNLQPHVHVSCSISAWRRACVPHPHRVGGGKGLDTKFKSTNVSFTPISWVQNVQIHSYSLTRASKWFLASIISAPKRGGEKKHGNISILLWLWHTGAKTHCCSRSSKEESQRSVEAMTTSSSEFWPQCTAHLSASVCECACVHMCERAYITLHSELIGNRQRSAGMVGGEWQLICPIWSIAQRRESHRSVGSTWFRLMSYSTQWWRPQSWCLCTQKACWWSNQVLLFSCGPKVDLFICLLWFHPLTVKNAPHWQRFQHDHESKQQVYCLL